MFIMEEYVSLGSTEIKTHNFTFASPANSGRAETIFSHHRHFFLQQRFSHFPQHWFQRQLYNKSGRRLNTSLQQVANQYMYNNRTMIKPLGESLLANKVFTQSSHRLLINYKGKSGRHNLSKVTKEIYQREKK